MSSRFDLVVKYRSLIDPLPYEPEETPRKVSLEDKAGLFYLFFLLIAACGCVFIFELRNRGKMGSKKKDNVVKYGLSLIK